MSKVPYEQFLVSLLCQHIDTSRLQDTKFHYICSDPSQATRLFNAFRAYSAGIQTLKIDDVEVSYVETASKIKVLVMLHHNGEDSKDTYSEDFIANVRDALNDIERAVLFVIHNSALDTILTSCQSLSADGQVFTPKYVHGELTKLAKDHPYPKLIEILSKKQLNEIVDQNLSVFGCVSLYNSIISHTVNFSEQGLFQDTRLFDIENKKEIQGDVNQNSALYSKISNQISAFSDNDPELIESLQSIGLGENFIKDNFIGKNKDKWEDLDFRIVDDEIEKNRKRKLDFISVEADGKSHPLFKREGQSGTKYKKITILIEADVGLLELKFRMAKGDPNLNLDQVDVVGDYQKHQVNLKLGNHTNQSVVTTRINYDGSVKLFQIKLTRPSSSENYQFNCLLVKKNSLSLSQIFEKLSVEFKRNKGRVLLENVTEPLILKPEIEKELVVDNTTKEINLAEFGSVNFGPYLKKETSAEVCFSYGEERLTANVVGKVTLDSIKLPSILDTNRSINIHTIEGNAKYNADTQQAIVSGKEKELSVDAKILCRIEHKLLQEGLLFLNEGACKKISLLDIAVDFPSIARAYQELFDWLQFNETILSLSSWPKELKILVEIVLDCFDNELASIPEGSLTDKHKNLLNIGVFHGSLKKDESDTDWLTPYHPIPLAYAYQLVSKLSESGSSITELPSITLDKLSPAGLLPIIYDQDCDYAFSVANSNNKLWIQIVPQQKNNHHHSFVAKLVNEKVNDFVDCFDMLFKDNGTAPLIINSIHNQSNKYIFAGLVSYFRKYKQKAKKIHVNLYDDRLYQTEFDSFSETTKLEEQRNLIPGSDKEKADTLDELLSILRDKLTYSKLTNCSNYDYSHIAFFKNNQKVEMKDKQVFNAKSGLACQGLLAGEASYLENNNYYTGFGLKGIEENNRLISIAEKYNSLLKPLKDPSSSYIKGVVPVLAVKDTFKDQLNSSYKSSIWTCIIDPKVTLDFFDDKNTILVHYSEHYTNSVAYDAIIVSSRISIYKGLLKENANELINSFNAVSGQWLLDIIKSAGKPQSKATEKQLKEKQGIVAAYKFLASFFLKSDITWIPLSIAELIRVTGNVGLKINGSDFSVRSQNKNVGAMCDDLLFVGFKERAMYLLPLEVKTREKGNDFTKAIKQAFELANHMDKLLSPDTFKGQVYRSLFIQHVMSQIERFELYKVFPIGYFDNLLDQRAFYQQGTYKILSLDNYVSGVAIAFNNSKETSRLSVDVDEPSNILTIEVPFGLMKALQSQSLIVLADKLTNTKDRPELAPYILTDTKGVPVTDEDLTSKSSDPDKRLTNKSKYNEIDVTDPDPTIVEVNDFSFGSPKEFKNLIELLVTKLNHTIGKEDILALTERDFKGMIGNDEKLLLEFFSLRSWLEKSEKTTSTDIESCRVLIGQALDTTENIYWEYGNKHLANRHLIVFGKSGQGKTYCIQGLLMEMAKMHCNSLIIDYTNGFLPKHLEKEFNDEVKPESHFLAKKPLQISPFRKQKQDFGGVIIEEQDHIVAARIASVFNQVYSSIGEQQIATLMNVIENGVISHGANYDFSRMLDDLREESKIGKTLANKLSPMVKSKLFDNSNSQSWQRIFNDPTTKINIVQLASFSRDIMQLATEFTLWDLYSYACSYGQKNKPLPIVLDEIQNLDHRLESPLGKMLTEGRKYGLSLILATQTLSMLEKEEQDRLFQASHKLFFAPAETEIQIYAKLLEQAVPDTNKKAWLEELAKLQKGECISVGLHKNYNGQLEQGAKVVKVAALAARRR